MDNIRIKQTKTNWGNVWYVSSLDGSFRFAIYRYNDDLTTIYLANVFVNRENRGKGLGNCILDATDLIAKKVNAKNIFLKVRKGTFAYEWYKRHGYVDFEDDETDMNYIWLKK